MMSPMALRRTTSRRSNRGTLAGREAKPAIEEPLILVQQYVVVQRRQIHVLLAQVLSLLGHPVAKVLREASKTSHEPMQMEVLLDHGFYEEVLRRAQELDEPCLVDFIRFEIDALNLATGVKLFTVGFEGPTEWIFLRGGRYATLSLFQRLAGGEMAALQELRDSDFGRVAETRDLGALERSMRCVLLAKARAQSKDVLGPGLAIDYIRCKEWETGRIRLLARHAYYDLPAASVEQEVFCE